MPKRGYTDEEEKLILRLGKDYPDNWRAAHAEFAKKFPDTPRSVGAIRARFCILQRRAATGKRPARKAANGQLRRLVQWLQRVAARADNYRAERDTLAAEARRLRRENRALKQANGALTGQLQRVKRIAEIFQRPGRSPRVEAAKVQHSKD